jgi:MFS family permease
LFYGWIITGTLAATETVSYGILYYVFAVFLVPMRAEFGWSRSTATGAFSLALLISGLSAPLVGIWLDRHGPRALMTAGSIAGSLLVLAWSRVDGIALYYAIWIGIGLAMAATFYEPAFATLTAWFERDRSRAILIVTIVAGFASTIFLPLAEWLEREHGWRDALTVLAGVLAALTIAPHALILRRRPEDLGLHPDGRADDGAASRPTSSYGFDPAKLKLALRDRTFWWITASFALQTFSGGAVSVYLISYLIDRGESAAFAASATGLIGAAQVGGRILTSVFGNRFSQVAITSGVFALQAVAVALLVGWPSHIGVLAAVLLLGAGRGIATLMKPAMIVDFFGRSSYGAISGSMALVLTIAGASAPVTAGAAVSWLGGYEPVLWMMAVFSLLAALAVTGARRAGSLSEQPEIGGQG